MKISSEIRQIETENVDILSTAVVYLCVNAVQHFLNDPHGEINTSSLPVPVPFTTIVCGVIIV